MPYVSRDASGVIDGVFANLQSEFAIEFLADDAPDVVAFLNPTKPAQILSQNLMAEFTPDDAAKIQAAIGTNPSFWLLWNALTTQKDPMEIGNVRFMAGWGALAQVLGADRMSAIATALGVTVT